MKIGLVDSGIGGLTVLECAKRLMPCADYIYYADELHVPYGEKTPEELMGYLEEIFQFFLDKRVDAIVIACNTATSVVSREYREQFPIPIIGMEPAVKKAVDMYQEENKRILVTATPITIQGRKLHELVEQVDSLHEVDLVSLPGLVHFAERGEFDSLLVEEYLQKEFCNLNVQDYGTAVLGCTHFVYFKQAFQKVLSPDIHLVDGNEGTIRQLMRVLHMESDKKTGEGKVWYYFSGTEINVQESELLQACMKQLAR